MFSRNNQIDAPNNSDGQGYWVKSGIITLTERAMGLLFSLGSTVLLLHYLSKEEFAAWSLFLLITYIMEMGRTGLIQNGMIRFLTLNREHLGQYGLISTAALFLSLMYSIISTGLLWMGLSYLTELWHTPQLAEMLPLYFVANFVMVLLHHFNFVQQSNFEFRGPLGGTFFMRGVVFFWVVFCMLTKAEIVLWHLSFAFLIGTILGSAASWLFASRFLHHSKTLSTYWVKELLRYGKYVLGTNLSTMLYKNVDKLVVVQLIGPAAYAIYDAAARVTQLIEAPSFSVAIVVFPQSARNMKENGKKGVADLYERSVSAILAMIIPFLLILFFLAEQVIYLFAGEAYGESVGILRLVVFYGLFLPFAIQFGTILDSTGKPWLNFLVTFLLAALNLTLSFLMVPEYGLYGAAYAVLAGNAIGFLAMQLILYRQFGIVWWKAFIHLPRFYRIAIELVKTRISYVTP